MVHELNVLAAVAEVSLTNGFAKNKRVFHTGILKSYINVSYNCVTYKHVTFLTNSTAHSTSTAPPQD
jgi:hypothetical protein